MEEGKKEGRMNRGRQDELTHFYMIHVVPMTEKKGSSICYWNMLKWTSMLSSKMKCQLSIGWSPYDIFGMRCYI